MRRVLFRTSELLVVRDQVYGGIPIYALGEPKGPHDKTPLDGAALSQQEALRLAKSLLEDVARFPGSRVGVEAERVVRLWEEAKGKKTTPKEKVT